jgi:two-component system, cell cycle response regulator DivK
MAPVCGRILVIDDSKTNVVLLEAVLNTHGYSTIKALNVKDAYSLIEKEKPVLILLDLLMPGTNGFDFLTIIKSNNDTKDIPVIVVSAVTDEENIMRSKALGAIDFITKPIDIQILVEKVGEIIGNPV